MCVLKCVQSDLAVLKSRAQMEQEKVWRGGLVLELLAACDPPACSATFCDGVSFRICNGGIK